MEERRKTPFVGPKHKTTPALSGIYGALKAIEDYVNEIDMLNYGGHKEKIRICVKTGFAEIDKLIRIENREVQRQEDSYAPETSIR